MSNNRKRDFSHSPFPPSHSETHQHLKTAQQTHMESRSKNPQKVYCKNPQRIQDIKKECRETNTVH